MINSPTHCLQLQHYGHQDFLTNIRTNQHLDLVAAVH